MKLCSFPFSLALVVFILFGTPKDGYSQCATNPSFSFTSKSLVSGTDLQLNAMYRFTEVMQDVDALITIKSVNNASVESMDIESLGNEGNWQPRVNILSQQSSGDSGFVDFEITFVDASTFEPKVISQIVANAVDVDGDGFRLREGVGFRSAEFFEINSQTNLISYVASDGFTIFESATVLNKSGISLSNTENMVSMTALNRASFQIRCHVKADRHSSISSAHSRYFAFNFDPCVPELYPDKVSFPVELTAFEGIRQDQQVLLNWTTASELNNDYFEIERSQDGVMFEGIGTVKGAGNLDTSVEYQFRDPLPFEGNNYYRLRQVDMDGQVNLSNSVEVSLEEVQRGFSFWPNPVSHQLTIQLSYLTEIQEMKLIDATGQEIGLRITSSSSDRYEIALDNNLPTGLYWLAVKADEKWLPGQRVMIAR